MPNDISSEGIVEAWDIATGRLLWKRRIYISLKVPSLLLETDVQLNFIQSMTSGPTGNDLTIVNEKGRKYILNVVSRTVKKV